MDTGQSSAMTVALLNAAGTSIAVVCAGEPGAQTLEELTERLDRVEEMLIEQSRGTGGR